MINCVSHATYLREDAEGYNRAYFIPAKNWAAIELGNMIDESVIWKYQPLFYSDQRDHGYWVRDLKPQAFFPTIPMNPLNANGIKIQEKK